MYKYVCMVKIYMPTNLGVFVDGNYVTMKIYGIHDIHTWIRHGSGPYGDPHHHRCAAEGLGQKSSGPSKLSDAWF